MIKTAHDKQTPANKNMEKWNPRMVIINGKNFRRIKPNVVMRVMLNVTPNSLIGSGITSPITENGSVKMAQEAKKMTVDNAANGIH